MEESRRRRRGYWRIYFRSRKKEIRRVVEATRRLLKSCSDPWTRPGRGRPYKYPAKEMVVLCVLKVYFDMSYLDVENLAPVLLGISPDDNTIWRAVDRLGEEYVASLAGIVAGECLNIHKVDFPVYVADSTGLGTPIKSGIQGPEVKLHTITLLPFNVVLVSRITPGQCHDSPVFREMLEGLWDPGLILGDPAYFSKENIAGCLKRHLIPVFKPKGELKDRFLTKYAVFFEAARRAYRYRGVAEGVYGAMENRFGCSLRSVCLKNQVTEGLLQVYVHNLKALFKAQEASILLGLLIKLLIIRCKRFMGQPLKFKSPRSSFIFGVSGWAGHGAQP